MPFKDPIKRREYNRINVKRWREKNKEKVRKRRKFLRDNFPGTKAKEKEYYRKNKAKILERQKKYQAENPQVKKKHQAKMVFTGKSKQRGKKDRKLLKDHYVKAQIEKSGNQKSVVEKKADILKYRIKKILKNDTNEK